VWVPLGCFGLQALGVKLLKVKVVRGDKERPEEAKRKLGLFYKLGRKKVLHSLKCLA